MIVLVNLGIGCDMMEVRDPVGLVGVPGEILLGDQKVGVLELVFSVSAGREREAALEV